MSVTSPARPPVPRGSGLFEIIHANGQRGLTNVRRLAGREAAPGSRLITIATGLLALLAAGLFVVTLNAQFTYIFAAKHQAVPSMIEAGALDVGMAIFSLLALGIAMAGQTARIERALIVACALGSAAQNYAAADVSSPRSVAAYVAPSLFLALVVDRVVAVVRRHVVGDDERSVWATVGRIAASMAKVLGLALLYLLRLVLAPPSTAKGLRQVVLVAAPLPGTGASASVDKNEDEAPLPASKKGRLLALYQRDPAHGDRGQASAVATRFAGEIGLSPGTARAYVSQYLNSREVTS